MNKKNIILLMVCLVLACVIIGEVSIKNRTPLPKTISLKVLNTTESGYTYCEIVNVNVLNNSTRYLVNKITLEDFQTLTFFNSTKYPSQAQNYTFVMSHVENKTYETFTESYNVTLNYGFNTTLTDFPLFEEIDKYGGYTQLLGFTELNEQLGIECLHESSVWVEAFGSVIPE
jgi:hypothetical protein